MMTPNNTRSAPLSPRDLVLTLRDLPSPPEAYYALSRLLDDPEWTPRRAGEIIECEPALAARLLRLVNSPYYGLSRQVGSIAEAVLVVGSRELRDLVLVTTVLDAFRGLPTDLISVHGFWRRAMGVAVHARLLAHENDALAGREGELFVAGLLHDIGSLIACLKVPELARQALLLGPQEGDPQFTVERAIFGEGEAPVGRELLQQWRLPPLLVAAVGDYPGPERAGEFAAAAAVVQLARQLTVAAEVGEQLSAEALSGLCRIAGIGTAALEELPGLAAERLEAARGMFNL